MKTSRQTKILQIIRDHRVRTQKELADFLEQSGVQVTQATLSRDIKALKLIKVHDENGETVYAAAPDAEKTSAHTAGTILNESVLSVDHASNIVVVKTLIGMAQGVASLLDRMQFPSILGSIAGDDTVMIVTRTEEDAAQVVGELTKGMR